MISGKLALRTLALSCRKVGMSRFDEIDNVFFFSSREMQLNVIETSL